MSEIDFDDFELPQEQEKEVLNKKYPKIFNTLIKKFDLIISFIGFVFMSFYGMILLLDEDYTTFFFVLIIIYFPILKFIFIALFKRLKSLKK